MGVDTTSNYGLHAKGPSAFYTKENGETVYYIDDNAHAIDGAMTSIQQNITEVQNNVTNILVQANPAFVFQQAIPLAVWVINHNLNGYPNVVIIDSSGQLFMGAVQYNTPNRLTVTFSAPFGGAAYLK